MIRLQAYEMGCGNNNLLFISVKHTYIQVIAIRCRDL